MPVYVCPECNKKLSAAEPPPAGKKIVCPDCRASFVPPAVAAARPVAAAVPAARPAAARPAAANPAAPAAKPIAAAPAAISPPPPPAPPPKPHASDDDEGPASYGLVQETEEEIKLAEAGKVKFGEVKDKYVKSARGPAMSLLVLPANLMIAEGALTAVAGLALIVMGGWPLVFTDSMPSDEEVVEALSSIFLGGFLAAYGALICIGASQMSGLGSYAWAMAGACLAVLPLLAGVFAIVTLLDKRVIDGFKEPESGPVNALKKEDDKKDDDDDEEEDDDDDDEEDEDDDEDDEYERPKRKKKR